MIPLTPTAYRLSIFTANQDALQAIYVAPVNMTALLLVFAGYIESSSYGGSLAQLSVFVDTSKPEAITRELALSQHLQRQADHAGHV